MTKTTLLASSAFAVLALAAPAEARGPYYFTAGGGANWLQDDGFIASTPATETLTFNPDGELGFVIHAAIGAHLDQVFKGFRIEAEGSYRQNDVGGLWTSNTVAPGLSSGTLDFDESVWAIMGNVWWDIDLGGSLKPYIGGGVGFAESKLDGTYQNSGATNPNFEFSDDGFAWQLGGGINWQLGPNVAVGLGYRYFSAPEVDVRSANAPNNAHQSVDVDSHAVMLDFTFAM